ncbi:DUF1653 domain-containing protein [Oceanobacter sp. 5_MG-2023]|uniref:DUF1653 domain-containing protein n=1 Tax=Oceanobacter sp. 5_MG-2023 TaxID=3062645 RepID=UPI0026E2F7C0|nr:DUF1653 domain-containing protein [Oceanobacter sp. 5_MG-2023]MDO6681961.1 DUF1653 domain-containing protein [Oceanobacter sp. 5_MG-2023]
MSQTSTANTTSHKPIPPAPEPLRPGRYRHYKGQDYEVFGLVRHSETNEWLVHYRTLYGDFSHWVRPYEMFMETVEVAGEILARFDYQGPMEQADSTTTNTSTPSMAQTEDN